MKTQQTIEAATLDEFESGVFDAVQALTSTLSNPDEWLIDALGGNRSAAGVRVNHATALALPSVWGNVQRIAGHLGLLPIEFRREMPDGTKQLLDREPGAVLLNEQPNEIQSPMIFRETLAMHALLYGNGRAWIERNGAGRPVSLLLLPPDTVTGMVGGEKYHSFDLDLGYYPEAEAEFDADPSRVPRHGMRRYVIHDSECFHLPGLGFNGIAGIDVVTFLKDTFGNDKAGQDTSSRSFANNGRPGLLLEAPETVLRGNKDAEQFIKSFNESHKGIDNIGKTGLLRFGVTAKVLPVSAQDAQHLEMRRYSREDIAMVFGTESLLGSSSVYKNLTERQAAYVQNCLQKWFTKVQQESERKLLLSRDRGRVHVKYNPKQLLTGDPNTLADYTGKLRQQGALSGNEVRVLHQMNPVPGLDSYDNPNISTGEPEPDTEPEAEQNQEDEAENV